jgi:hypothetical protein
MKGSGYFSFRMRVRTEGINSTSKLQLFAWALYHLVEVKFDDMSITSISLILRLKM